jgi:hypothetical protein
MNARVGLASTGVVNKASGEEDDIARGTVAVNDRGLWMAPVLPSSFTVIVALSEVEYDTVESGWYVKGCNAALREASVPRNASDPDGAIVEGRESVDEREERPATVARVKPPLVDVMVRVRREDENDSSASTSFNTMDVMSTGVIEDRKEMKSGAAMDGASLSGETKIESVAAVGTAEFSLS